MAGSACHGRGQCVRRTSQRQLRGSKPRETHANDRLLRPGRSVGAAWRLSERPPRMCSRPLAATAAQRERGVLTFGRLGRRFRWPGSMLGSRVHLFTDGSKRSAEPKALAFRA